jgi:hypothetical protein
MRKFLFLLIPLTVVILLWNSVFLYPLKLLVVFFHESSHALMTIITGGRVHEMVVSALQGGHVKSSGGIRFLTLSAGYLGSLCWGALIYLLAACTRRDREVMFSLGLVVTGLTLFYMSPFKGGVGASWGYLFCLLTGVFLVFSARKLSDRFNDMLLRIIGLTSMIYAPLDIYSDVLLRSYLRSDARMLAEEIGGTTVFWGISWVLISLVVVALVVRVGLKNEAE